MTELTEAASDYQAGDSINFCRLKAGSPASDCILAIEDIIREKSGEYTKNAVYKKLPVQYRLPKDAMNTMFMQIMDYLLESKKISVDRLGHICWTYDPDVADCYKNSEKLKFPANDSKGSIFFESMETLFGYRALLSSSDIEEQHVLKSLNDAALVLKDNLFAGELIPKRLIPKKYDKTFKSCNLWRYSLGSSWKLIYRVASDDSCRIGVIADCLKGRDYERLFGDL